MPPQKHVLKLLKTIKKYKDDLRQKQKNPKSSYGFIMLIVAPLIGIQSSEGLLSIYIVWMTLFYAFLITFESNEGWFKNENIKIIIYQPTLNADVVVANKIETESNICKDKVYTRDLFARD